jgi:formate hydrogenlyase subunit 3/multisubunit Na+/H+ antiporter MnhD subunit
MITGELPQILLLLTTAFPFFLTLAAAASGGRGGGWLSCIAALPALAAAILLPAGTHVDLPWILLGSGLLLDMSSKIFLLFISLLYLLAALYAQGYLAKEIHKGRFYIFFLAAMTGNFGVLVAQDIALFYLFFALMSFSAYVLVIHSGSQDAMRAGRVYIVLVLLGEVLIFSGLLLTSQAAASLDIFEGAAALAKAPASGIIIAMLLVGFGIKAGIVPLHLWLPLAHPVAPTPASAVLSGAMIKTGLFGLMRFLPLGYASLPGWGAALALIGLFGIFFGVFVGVTQRDAKTVLAYSSISQMGYIIFGLGIGLGAPEYWPELMIFVSLYALHHGLSKGALFLGVGVAPAASRRMPGLLVSAGLLWPALALGGAPFTSGILAKSALKPHLYFTPLPWPQWSELILSFAAIGTTALMGRYFFLLWQRKEAGHRPAHTMLGAWGVLVGVSALLPWTLPITLGFRREAVELIQIAGALWPVVLGMVLTWIIWRGGIRAATGLRIPPGDLLVVAEWVLRHAADLGRRWPSGPPALSPQVSPPASRRAPIDLLEKSLTGWLVVGLFFLLLILVQFVLFIRS